jgi:5-methylcytosine-specific restriction endonuclease McrA
MPPFYEQVRKEVFRRDRGECQNPTCVCQSIYGERAKFRDGFHVQASHYPALHQRGYDDNPENGRILDTTCHIIEELERGNEWGAKMLYDNHTIRNYHWLRENGGTDEKLSFDWYRDYAFGGAKERAELVQTARDILGVTPN